MLREKAKSKYEIYLVSCGQRKSLAAYASLDRALEVILGDPQ